ncbi:MAG: zinc ribbon domain-containing protein [Dehalococcoidia bacterium]
MDQLTDWQNALILVAVLFALYILVMWAAAVVWTYRDIRARTNEPFEQASSVLLVAIFNIPGLLLHVLMRPKTTIEDQMDRRLEAEAMFQDIQERPACPQCAARIQPDFILCPQCRAQLRTPCADCSQPLAVDWVMCPYCTADRTPAPLTVPRRRPAASTLRPSVPAPRTAFAAGRPRA